MFAPSCLCWCFARWMCCIVLHVSPSAFHKSSLMCAVQCFVSAEFVPFPSFAHTRCAHIHTTPACHLVGTLISSSLVLFFFTPSLSAFNLLSLSSFSCSRSLYTRSWPHPAELNIQPLSSWMQIQECDKSVWFLSSHFAVVTESKTLNTALTQPGLFTAPSMQTQPQKCLHTSACAHLRPYRMHVHTHTSTHVHSCTGKTYIVLCVCKSVWVCVCALNHFLNISFVAVLLVFLVFPCIFGSLISFNTRSKYYLI